MQMAYSDFWPPSHPKSISGQQAGHPRGGCLLAASSVPAFLFLSCSSFCPGRASLFSSTSPCPFSPAFPANTLSTHVFPQYTPVGQQKAKCIARGGCPILRVASKASHLSARQAWSLTYQPSSSLSLTSRTVAWGLVLLAFSLSLHMLHCSLPHSLFWPCFAFDIFVYDLEKKI